MAKIKEALLSALPITAIVYVLALTPWFDFSHIELITFTIGAVLLVVGLGLFSLGADLAMTPMGSHVGAGLSRQKKLGLLLSVCFVLGMLITIAEPDLQVLAEQVSLNPSSLSNLLFRKALCKASLRDFFPFLMLKFYRGDKNA